MYSIIIVKSRADYFTDFDYCGLFSEGINAINEVPLYLDNKAWLRYNEAWPQSNRAWPPFNSMVDSRGFRVNIFYCTDAIFRHLLYIHL